MFMSSPALYLSIIKHFLYGINCKFVCTKSQRNVKGVCQMHFLKTDTSKYKGL